ncbi:hypothetical protein C3B64_19900 [Clostridium botulinum]|uniref:TIGR04255 family protein n=1 Tax=Clostridium botulinum TaxID=1491 RepID=A0AAU8Z2S5_CLOBO|nr:abortive infection system antitoxin AbiGi family protein [Clostridium sporogenes]AVP66357.1 hypothetical protein C3B64_19900 [Clostridium botulinum]MCF4017193.1 abortive infection system antitoxin AbiGi family protein [Clostridium sporogenes]NFG03730.1 hypothetical protein [Clostridium sporogenes]
MKDNVMQVSEIDIPSKESNQIYICPKQSANVLFKFMKELEYLKDIIKNKAIIPRYCQEDIEYLNVEGLEKIAFPMSCFCDIQLNKLEYHMEKYGEHGIGMNKEWGIREGLQPINYINSQSNLKKDFTHVFLKAMKLEYEGDLENTIDEYNNNLLTSLCYMKPICGKMIIQGKYEQRNFHDEREWRYIPDVNNVNTGLPQLIPAEQLNEVAYDSYSKGIVQCEKLWLKFEYDNIKHIIVKGVKDREELISFIINDINAAYDEKMILVSKILVFKELKEDW